MVGFGGDFDVEGESSFTFTNLVVESPLVEEFVSLLSVTVEAEVEASVGLVLLAGFMLIGSLILTTWICSTTLSTAAIPISAFVAILWFFVISSCLRPTDEGIIKEEEEDNAEEEEDEEEEDEEEEKGKEEWWIPLLEDEDTILLVEGGEEEPTTFDPSVLSFFVNLGASGGWKEAMFSPSRSLPLHFNPAKKGWVFSMRHHR